MREGSASPCRKDTVSAMPSYEGEAAAEGASVEGGVEVSHRPPSCWLPLPSPPSPPPTSFSSSLRESKRRRSRRLRAASSSPPLSPASSSEPTPLLRPLPLPSPPPPLGPAPAFLSRSPTLPRPTRRRRAASSSGVDWCSDSAPMPSSRHSASAAPPSPRALSSTPRLWNCPRDRRKAEASVRSTAVEPPSSLSTARHLPVAARHLSSAVSTTRLRASTSAGGREGRVAGKADPEAKKCFREGVACTRVGRKVPPPPPPPLLPSPPPPSDVLCVRCSRPAPPASKNRAISLLRWRR